MTTSLPPTDPSAPDDKLPGETELAALYRQLPLSEPGPALDAAVLRAAAQALEITDGQPQVEPREGPRESGDRIDPRPPFTMASRTIPSVDAAARRRRRRVPHWLVGLGSAASLVLVAGLAWHMREMPGPSPKYSATDGGTAAKQASVPASSSNPAEASPGERSMLNSSAQMQTPAPMQPKGEAHLLPPAVLPGLKPVTRGGSATAAKADILNSKLLGQDGAAAMNASGQAVSEKRAASVPQQPASADEAKVFSTAAPVGKVAPPAPSAPAASSRREDSPTAANPGDTPEQELAKIQQLVQQDRQAEARQRLQAFHRVHPQWNLPADLRGLLGKP